ncbi:hypothetical protein G5V59_26855 [Nocardioides sp. W3-2-3]|uniref:hypothetical protein n=1 Tax=Nocardioides convexus TaxID=2712224 RepID=UPI002418AB3D|nr:hypothetical protein [Nocardioides convexus]NHA02013.1 hypothetical protein [Nocardioides convexus]
MLETRALDALREIAALHQPTYLDAEGNEHRLYVLVSNPPEGHVCVIDGHDRCDPELEEHAVLACTECQWTDPETSIAGYLLWPCPTFRATQARHRGGAARRPHHQGEALMRQFPINLGGSDTEQPAPPNDNDQVLAALKRSDAIANFFDGLNVVLPVLVVLAIVTFPALVVAIYRAAF